MILSLNTLIETYTHH